MLIQNRRAAGAIAVGLVALFALVSCEDSRDVGDGQQAVASKAATEGWIRVVRGANAGPSCNAAAIGSGNDPKVGVAEDLTNLSVSCSANQTDTVADLRKFLPNNHACASSLAELRKARREVTVVRDPTAENPFHCLLGTITPNQFVSRARFYQ